MEGTEQTQAAPAKRRNILPRIQTRKAMEWMEANRLEVGAKPRAEVAQTLERYLGHPVTIRNVESLAKDTGVELHHPQPKPEQPCRTLAQLLTRITRLEEIVEKLTHPMLPAAAQEA